jgi:hypothetical protein
MAIFHFSGAMCAICDVNEYRKCVKEFKVPLVNTLFDTLHALCNLLLVKPENLKQVCTGDQLVRTQYTFSITVCIHLGIQLHIIKFCGYPLEVN